MEPEGWRGERTDDPSDHEEWHILGRQERDHSLLCKPHGEHTNEVDHPEDHEARRTESRQKG